jgi:uncharacterized membrane protein
MNLPLKSRNLLIILVGVALIGLGYILMATENFIDATEFSLALKVCPTLIVLGHVVVVIGILLRSGSPVAAKAEKNPS